MAWFRLCTSTAEISIVRAHWQSQGDTSTGKEQLCAVKHNLTCCAMKSHKWAEMPDQPRLPINLLWHPVKLYPWLTPGDGEGCLIWLLPLLGHHLTSAGTWHNHKMERTPFSVLERVSLLNCLQGQAKDLLWRLITATDASTTTSAQIIRPS